MTDPKRARAALYPGSFDPVHLGHVSVVDRAVEAFGAVVVAVLGNPSKQVGMFSVEQRLELLAATVGRHERVRCVAFDGLAVDAAKAFGCDAVIRTGHKDVDDEWSMLAMNQLVGGTRTIFFSPDPALASLSSSRIRGLMDRGASDEAAALVPATVAAALAARAGRARTGTP